MKDRTVEQVQAEFAKVLLMCLKQGRMLTLLCSTSAPPMTSKFAANCPHFPARHSRLHEKVKPVVGDEGVINGSWVERVVTWSEGEGLHTDPSYGPIIQVHKDFRVVVVTKFADRGLCRLLGRRMAPRKDAANACLCRELIISQLLAGGGLCDVQTDLYIRSVKSADSK